MRKGRVATGGINHPTLFNVNKGVFKKRCRSDIGTLFSLQVSLSSLLVPLELRFHQGIHAMGELGLALFGVGNGVDLKEQAAHIHQ